MYANKHNFAPRLGIAKNLPGVGLVFHAAYGIFFTPVDLGIFTWYMSAILNCARRYCLVDCSWITEYSEVMPLDV